MIASARADVVINTTNFPDMNFRRYLLSQSYGYDGVLTNAEIANVGSIYLLFEKVENLKGIEYFTSLTYLDCSGNKLSSLDVSNNTRLLTLYCDNNQLTTINVSGCSALNRFTCGHNQLNTLDLSKNTNLKYLDCSYNLFGFLDVSKNTNLKNLYCRDNQLSSIDVSYNSMLEYFDCSGNQLTSLDLSYNNKLYYLYFYHNQINGTGMDALVQSLPVSGEKMYVIDNEGDDNVMTTTQVRAAKSKGWTPCCCVDNKWRDYIGSNDPMIEDIEINATNFPDANFRNYLLSQSYGMNGIITDVEIIGITSMSVENRSIQNLKGIEYFTELTQLYCSYNQLTSLDLSKNTALKTLYCYGNQIKGRAMDALVKSLPTVSQGNIYVIYGDSENNVMTIRQVANSKAKGWTPYYYSNWWWQEYAGSIPTEPEFIRGDVNGDDVINGTDIQAVINLIVASQYDEFADVNKDNKVNGTDIQEIINIILNPEDNPSEEIDISGIVYYYGSPMSGVKVKVGTASVTTGYNGMFTLNKVGGSAVKFEKEGYATITRAISADNTQFDISMTDVQISAFSASTAPTLNIGWNGMMVGLPAYYNYTNGNAYTGFSVTAKSAYLTPDDDGFSSAMPGNLKAIRADQSEAVLISYGMISVELTGDSGEKLQLGAPATLTFPAPASAKEKYDVIPLWSYNEETCLWEEEGVAVLNSDASAYVGTVSHFSWHNLAYPEVEATLNVKVVDSNGNDIVGIPVDFDGQQTVYTNSKGIASGTVSSYTDLLICIPSEAYGNYAASYDEYGYLIVDETKIVKQNVRLNPQSTQTITMAMPGKAPLISGKVTYESGKSNVCTLWITYGNIVTTHVASNSNGEYSLYGPFSYRGTAKIVARFEDGYKVERDITITDTDQKIDITANSSDTTKPGVIYVKGEGLNTWYELPSGNNGVWEGSVSESVNIEDGTKCLRAYIDFGGTDYSQGWGGLNISIPNYDDSKTTYTSSANSFEYFMEGMGSWIQIACGDAVSTIEVTKNGDVYNFKFSGPGTLLDASLGADWDSKIPVTAVVEFSIKSTEQTR